MDITPVATPERVEAIEQFLAQLWAEVLFLEVVTPDDNVLDLGGDSIAAAVGVNRVHQKYGVELTVESLLLDRLSVRQMAQAIASRSTSAAD